MNLLAFLFTLTAALCWAADQTIGKIALRRTDVSVFNAIRPSFVAPLIILFALSTNSLSYPGLELTLLGALSGVIVWCVACELYFYLLKEGAAHRILPIANSYPIWAVIASLLILREEATSPVFVSAILVFIGAYFLIPRGKKAFNWSKVVPLAFLVAVMWGVIVVPTKYCISKGVTTSTFLAIEVISAALACDIIMSIRYLRSGIHLDKRGGGLSAFSGFLGFFVGHLLFLSALGMERASVLAPVCGAVIPFGFLLSIILLGERPSKKAILGMGIVFVGVFLATI